MTVKDDAVSSLSPEVRAELIKAGVPFPGETPDEAACRFRREFDILTEEVTCPA